jgi:hypothetical protein
VLHVTDVPFLNAAAVVTRQRLESACGGAYATTVGAEPMIEHDLSKARQLVRTRKEPPDKGGWNLFHTWLQAAGVVNPAVHLGHRGRRATRLVWLA